MNSDLSEEEMRSLLDEHAEAEFQRDMERTLRTLVPNPHYEYHPLGYIIDGMEAVKEHYVRIIPRFIPCLIKQVRAETWKSDEGLWRRGEFVARLSSGAEVPARCVAYIPFQGRLIAGEIVYMDRVFSQLVREALGDDFLSVAGVKYE